jgi:alpha-L-fucosidase
MGGGHWDPAQDGDMDQYIKTIAVPQVREILTRYTPDILWWDTPKGMNEERAALFMPLFKDHPNIITNNRLGGGYHGDTETPEQRIPATGYKDRDWEVCMTMNNTWGYKSYDNRWKSTADLLRKLCDIVSKGGNFLLNVGPKPDGTIPQESIDRLHEIGQWMKVNGEAIYGTTASPFTTELSWGRVTVKENTLYLHVFDWPADRRILLPGLKSNVARASLLAGGTAVATRDTTEGVELTLPEAAPDPNVSVIKVELDDELNIHQDPPTPQPEATRKTGHEKH